MIKSKRPLKSVTLRLYDGDTETLKRFFQDFGYNIVLREKIHQLCKTLLAREEEAIAKLTQSEIQNVELDPGNCEPIDDGED